MRRADATVSVSVGSDGFVTASPRATPQPGLPSPGDLPFTGTLAGALTLAALLLIVTGLALIVLSHRKGTIHA